MMSSQYLRQAYELVPDAVRSGFAVLGRNWLPYAVGIIGVALFEGWTAGAWHAFQLRLAASTIAGVAEGVFFFFVYASVMRLRWPEYRQSAGKVAYLVLLCIGIGFITIIPRLPGYYVSHFVHHMVLGEVLTQIGYVLIMARMIFVLYAADYKAGPYFTSWYATAGALYAPSVIAYAIVTILDVAFAHLVALPLIHVGTATATALEGGLAFAWAGIIAAAFGVWTIRWMPIAESEAHMPEALPAT